MDPNPTPVAARSPTTGRKDQLLQASSVRRRACEGCLSPLLVPRASLTSATVPAYRQHLPACRSYVTPLVFHTWGVYGGLAVRTFTTSLRLQTAPASAGSIKRARSGRLGRPQLLAALVRPGRWRPAPLLRGWWQWHPPPSRSITRSGVRPVAGFLLTITRRRARP